MATQSLLTLTRALEQASVPALVIKCAVCRSLYPSPDLRPSSDEDILIPPESPVRGGSGLETLGYRLAKEEKTRMTRCEPGIRTGCGWSSTGVFAEI